MSPIMPTGERFSSRLSTEKYFRNLVKSKPNLDCKCTFPIDAAPNKVPIGVESFEKCVIAIQIWFAFTRIRKDLVCEPNVGL